MSFYLLPPVSYQTQQKLKRQMNDKKSKTLTHKPSTSSAGSGSEPSAPAPATASTPATTLTTTTTPSANLQRSRSRSRSHSSHHRSNSFHSTDLPQVKSSLHPDTQCPYASKSANSPTQYNVDDIHDTHDSHTIGSDTTAISSNDSIMSSSMTRKDSTVSTLSKEHSKKVNKQKSSTFNYECTSDINEIIKFNKETNLHRRVRHKSISSIPAEGDSTESASNETVHPSDGTAHPHTDLQQAASPMGPLSIHIPSSNFTIDEASEEESDLAEDVNVNFNGTGLTKTYSNVSSIFSTTKDEPSGKAGPFFRLKSPRKSKGSAKSSNLARIPIPASPASEDSFPTPPSPHSPVRNGNSLTARLKKKFG